MESDGQREGEVVAECMTSVLTDQQQRESNEVTTHTEFSLLPLVSRKAVPRAAGAQESGCVQVRNEGRHREQINVVRNKAQQQQKQKQKNQHLESANSQLRKVRMAAREDQRQKRKRQPQASVRDSTGLSQTSARMLFHCSCQLLRNQILDYDVRAREMEERNAAQTRAIDAWEKKIRRLKRELAEYTDEQLDEATDMARVEATPCTTTREGDEPMKALPSTGAMFGTIETSLPPAVLAVEAKVQDELRTRSQKVKEFCQSIPGFIQSRDEQTSRFF